MIDTCDPESRSKQSSFITKLEDGGIEGSPAEIGNILALE